MSDIWLKSGAIISNVNGGFDIGFGSCRQFRQTESPLVKWFSPSDFFSLGSGDFCVYGRNEQIAMADLQKSLSSCDKPDLDWEGPNQSLFETHFLNVQKSISKGIIHKAVPYVFERANCEIKSEHIAYFLGQLLKSTTKGFVFGQWDLERGWGVLGLTPELFFSREAGSRAKTMALAGTAKGADHSLLEDEKEMVEHRLVVHGLQESLLALGIRPDVSATYEWSPGALTHLRTDLSFALDDRDSYPVLRALHPTPALGGYPQRPSHELLRSFSRELPRFSFGAPFGVQHANGEALFVVQIRCLIFENSNLWLGSGCGVVKDSVFMNEWAELERKRNSVKSVFGLL